MNNNPNALARVLETVRTNRVLLLTVLLGVVVAAMMAFSAAGYTSGAYNPDYMATALINAVPLAMLGLAQMLVILSGRAGIDLSVGAVVSLSGVVFGFAYGIWEWPLWLAILLAVAVGVVCGTMNGVLVAYIGFPPIIATLATFYALKSLALLVSNQSPINTPPIQDFYSAAQAVEIPLVGAYLPLVPLGLLTFLVPVAVLVWFIVNRTTFGRTLYASGTNDTAALWAALPNRRTRCLSYSLAGGIAGLTGVFVVAQFASARPDAGVTGNGMSLPAITIAVLGGVAITGGIGRVSGVLLATLVVVWLNAGILLLFPGNEGSQMQLLALGVLLLGASLLNGSLKIPWRRKVRQSSTTKAA
ncbi:hypothetical protein GCM10028820_14280 [Tessaracoccus terricola]